MVEFLKHFFGICGEAHPNLFTILFATPVVSYLSYSFYRIKKGGKKPPLNK